MPQTNEPLIATIAQAAEGRITAQVPGMVEKGSGETIDQAVLNLRLKIMQLINTHGYPGIAAGLTLGSTTVLMPEGIHVLGSISLGCTFDQLAALVQQGPLKPRGQHSP